MSLADLKASLPDYAKDLRLNLESVLSEGGAPGLTRKQIALVALASAIAARHEPLVRAILADSAAHVSEAELNGARAAAAIMAMTNVYFRAVHLMGAPEYQALPSRLRMNRLAHPGVQPGDYELWCLAVSAINGCGACLDSHEAELRKRGVDAVQVQAALRIAGVVNAVGRVLAFERADHPQVSDV